MYRPVVISELRSGITGVPKYIIILQLSMYIICPDDKKRSYDSLNNWGTIIIGCGHKWRQKVLNMKAKVKFTKKRRLRLRWKHVRKHVTQKEGRMWEDRERCRDMFIRQSTWSGNILGRRRDVSSVGFSSVFGWLVVIILIKLFIFTYSFQNSGLVEFW